MQDYINIELDSNRNQLIRVRMRASALMVPQCGPLHRPRSLLLPGVPSRAMMSCSSWQGWRCRLSAEEGWVWSLNPSPYFSSVL